MKRTVTAIAFLMIIISAGAQDQKSKIEFEKGFHFSAGVNTAFPISDFGDVSSFGAGVELNPEYRLSRRIGIVGATGYTEFFGKDDLDNFGFIPVVVGLRGYLLPHFFIGSKWGVGILTGGGESSTAFDAQPGLGYDAKKIQATLGLNIQRKSGESISHFTFSLLYKFK